MFLFILLLNIIVCAFAACPTEQIQSVSDPTICYSFENTRTNWFVSMQKCKDKGGNLVSLHNMLENMFVNGEAKSVFTESTNNDFWVGAIYNSLSPGKWSWIDNSTFDFNDWDKGQPENITDSVCASSVMNGAKWHSNDCFIDKPFVCEIKQISMTTIKQTTKTTRMTTATSTTTTKTLTKMCPDPWIYFNTTDYCYKASHSYSTWEDAEKYCVYQGAHLVSIHSYSENLFVASIASRNGSNYCDWYSQAWIGLSKNSGNYKWTDGTLYDYSSWQQGGASTDPNHSCALTWIGQTCYENGIDNGATEWNSLICNGKAYNHVCKKARV